MIVLILLIIIIYLYLVKPNNKRKESLEDFSKYYIAHRGFFNNDSEAPENSLNAFRRAVLHGYGIELDVQLTKDNKLIVFHDDNLKRACGVDRKVEDLTYKELSKYNLFKSTQKIPLFKEVLQIITPKTPLVVEIKPDGRWEEASIITSNILKDYHGIYCVESFNPNIVEWFRVNRKDLIRGQLSTDYFKDNSKHPVLKKFVLTNLLCDYKSRPDFIAYNVKYTNEWSFFLVRKIFNPVTAAWTIKSQEQLDEAKKVYDIFIFDSFEPK